MGYATGSLSGADTFESLHTLLSDFLTDEGWTVVNGVYPALQAHKGECFVNLAFTTTATLNDTLGSTASAVSPDYRIEGRLGPDATPVPPAASNERVVSNDWLGPYSNYWLFGPAVGEPSYVHFVVQKANGRFCQISFGEIDQKGAGYDGGAFLEGMYWAWNFNSATLPSSGNSGEGSDMSSGSHRSYGDATEDTIRSTFNIYLGDLDASRPVIANPTFGTYDTLTPLWSRTKNLSGASADQSAWLGWVFHIGPNPISGVTPLFELPFIWENTTSDRGRFLGTEPGRRICSMIGRLEAETISFGSDDWVVFPWKRALPWTPEPWATKTVTSGPLGHAFKVNV